MTIPGIGATPEQPQKPDMDIAPQNPKTPKNSIWVSFVDSDNKVDINDVEFSKDAPEELRNVFENKIKNFLKKYQQNGASWNDELLEKLGLALDKYTEACNKWYNELKKQTEPEGKDALEKHFDQIAAGYADQFNNFETQANNELKQLNKDGAYEILNNLENGFNGCLNIDGVGIVTYNADSESYTIKYADNSYKDFSKSDIRKEIEKYIDDGYLVSGDSNKTVHK
jgi:hypothetical protein